MGVPLAILKQGHRPHTIYGEGWYGELCSPGVRCLMAWWHWSITDGMQDRLVNEGILFG